MNEPEKDVVEGRVRGQAATQLITSSLAMVVGTIYGIVGQDWKGFLFALFGLGAFLYWRPVWRLFRKQDR